MLHLPLTAWYDVVMGTNFYAHWAFAENVNLTLHIGKRTRNGIATFSGAVFPTVEAWTTFLRHNSATVQIRDEYDHPVDTEDFITEEILARPNASEDQISWLRAHGYTIANNHISAQPDPNTSYWLDGDRLFCKVEFS